ncbi:MAG: type I-Fv CRISPR-associated protein Cas5fv [Methyloprofundus sp.]|nr:type I-Fv CRISPR-associated protein Cas5fv [Methyloprofundus sp.]MDT8426427.1 type I-Fv CRISPR-associated protein Cas5fv [Methyloprofundus sp.]
MKITIEYESSWRNSFLDGSNNEPLPKGGRKFIGSMTNLKKPENFIKRDVTLDTVMGILNRLIGDQKKLYQSRLAENYYFKEIESLTSFTDNPTRINDNEMTYIRNMTGSTDQNSFSGIIKVQDPVFLSDYSPEFWGVLALDLNELCQFILEKNKVDKTISLDPISIISRLEILDKEKPVINDGEANQALQVLNQHFPDANYLSNKGEIFPIMFYCSALYLQLERLKDRFDDIDTAKTKSGTISGISKRGFTKKDFMKRFTTGSGKLIFGNPYIRKERVKGVGEVAHFMTKASGQLEIEIDVDRDKAKEIQAMIENAGVSSFYLGKKGLAYVCDIDPRPRKH